MITNALRRTGQRAQRSAQLDQYERIIESTARQIELNYGRTAADEALRKAQSNLRK